MAYPYTSPRTVCLLGLLLLVALPAAATNPRVPLTLRQHGRMIRLAGKLVERASQRPLRRATIMVKCGDMVLANRQSDEQGEFIIFIPPEKLSRQTLSIKIKYQNHVFIQDEIDPVSQELLVEINGAIFLESTPIKDYQLPMHRLGSPRVGRVLIRTHYRPKADPQVEEEDVEIVRTR